MEQEKISVVIPVYKVEKYLDKCMESVTGQTHKNLEIILVDDGSPDACPKMCDEWAKKDGRVKVIHKQNGGLSDARNFGIDAATGKYLTFIDSDDYLDLNFCETLLNELKNNNADMVIGGVKLVYENPANEKVKNSKTVIDDSVFSVENVNDLIYDKKFPHLMTAWAKLYKKELFREIRFPVGRLHEDEFVYFQILFNCKKLAVNRKVNYFYLQRGTSIMSNKSEKNLRDILDAFEEKFNFIEAKFPQKHEQNLELYALELRNLYSVSTKYKQIKKEIIDKFNNVYKGLKKKGLKNWLFKNFRMIYLLLLKIKSR